MHTENEHTQPLQEGNEDLSFDKNTVSTTYTQPITDNEELPEEAPIDESKQEELSSSDFPPLSDVEKQPKLQDEERMQEMNERTSIGD